MNLRAETVKSGSLSLEHCYNAEGTNGTGLLFVHSAGHGSWMWKNFLPYFARLNYDSWAINLRGHYLSDPVPDWAAVGLLEYLDDLDLAVQKIGTNCVLIGHSMSGLLILKYAEHKTLKGLIVSQSGPPAAMLQKRGIELKGPGPKPGQGQPAGTARPPMKDRDAVKAMLFDLGNVTEDAVSLVVENMGEESVRAGAEIMRMEVDPAAVTAPVFVLGFNAAKIGMQTPMDVNKLLAEEYNAKDYRIIEPGGHDYMLEKNWQDFARQFEAWIASAQAPAA